jgi:hypothetical protein
MNELTQHLNWDVQIEELVLPGNRKTDRFALTRSDNGEILSVRSERYHPVFNKDLEQIREHLVAHSGFQFQGYQEFQNGKRILAFYENPSEKLQICGQDVKDYLIIGNSHDTSSKLFVGTSNYMIRCENQFSEKIRAFERRHDQPFNINEINIVNILNNYEVGRKKLYQRMDTLRQRPANQNTINHLINQLFGTLDNTDRLEQANPKETEQTQLLRQCISREVQDLGMNYWALLNGVTRYTSNHLKGNPGFGIVNGTGERLNREAMRALEGIL